MSSHRSESTSADVAPIFSALGDKVRLSLLTRLQDGQARSVLQLTDGSGLTRQGIRKHLSVLEEAGLVTQERVGRECKFIYHPAGISEAKNFLEHASKQWDQAVDRLKDMLEEN